MKPGNQRRRQQVSSSFPEAAKLASEHGMILRELAYAGAPSDVTHYRIEGPGGAWFKDLYPGPQRIFCPDKVKQGPFISMRINQRWDLLDIVKVCIKAMEKEKANPKVAKSEDAIVTGESNNTQQILKQLINAVEIFEGTVKQCALRDVLTDLRHVADELKLDYHEAEKGSYEVYLEEKVEDTKDSQPGVLIPAKE